MATKPKSPKSRSKSGNSVDLPTDIAGSLLDSFDRHLTYTQCKDPSNATPYDQFVSLALAVRDALVKRQLATREAYRAADAKRVFYLSMEFLIGRQLRGNLLALGALDAARDGLKARGIDLDELCEVEPDAGLGNGGLGRLAACYLDSMAALRLPGYGYGLRYEYGIFEQAIDHGWQVERPDYWLRFGSPWEIVRPELACPVRLYGYVEDHVDEKGRFRPQWRGYKTVIGVPYDMLVPAVGSPNVNLLRLWSARASESFDLDAFNRGGYVEAVRERAMTETITKVLYPADELDVGKELRLAQQYFFVACTLNDILRRYEAQHDTYDALPDKAAIQLNDTHPSLAIAELMRIFIDERGLTWEKAWSITTRCFAYTNHTLLPEALETWRISLFSTVLPRHLQIIYEINRRFLEEVERKWPADTDRKARMSLVQEQPVRMVRMAHLAIVGSHHVNGVAALHSELIRKHLVPDFAELSPAKFVNKTNGITHRRFLLQCNPELSSLITRRIGDGWIGDLSRLKELEPLAADAEFLSEFRAAKAACKQRLVQWVRRRTGVSLPTDALFDVQVKRLHEYKRQYLNILQVIHRYQRILENPGENLPPRVVIFAAKAAPAYHRAKLIIKLINDVAAVVNTDKRVDGRLKVVFIPNYSVSLAELIIPGADLSEQISLAGTEASGTGNMKFALNGALTIGTLDGANIEIRDAVGAENFFEFGMTADQVQAARADYNPWNVYHANIGLRHALDAIGAGLFCPDFPSRFKDLFDSLTHHRDHYMLLGDFDSYLAAQTSVDRKWADQAAWTRSAALNVARMGYFSSDRAVREYAQEIWGVAPLETSVRSAPSGISAADVPSETGGAKRAAPRRSAGKKREAGEADGAPRG